MAFIRDSQKKLIPVFCNVEIPATILNRLLYGAYSSTSEENERLFILTTKNPPAKPQPSIPPVEQFPSPFQGQGRRQWIEGLSSHEDITDDVFVTLDSLTIKDGNTCSLVSRKVAHFFSVRSDFASAQLALDAILDGSSNIQRLRNEAAIAGEVLRNYLLSKSVVIHDQDGEVVEFQNVGISRVKQ